MLRSLRIFLLSIFLIVTGLLVYKTITIYPGNPIIYLLFSIIFNLLFLLGFSRKRIFFDTFIGTLLWLGFWVKFSIRISFLNARFVDPVGFFNHSPAAYDLALIVSLCGAAGLLVACLMRRCFSFSYLSHYKPYSFSYLSNWYYSNRRILLSLFLFTVIFISFTNGFFGFYQRGRSPLSPYNFLITGTYTWLLFFGLASISGFILNLEASRTNPPWVASLTVLFECFLSNISMLSRGFILNSSALIWGYYYLVLITRIKQSLLFVIILLLIATGLFAGSIFGVNFIRSYLYSPIESTSSSIQLHDSVVSSAIKSSSNEIDAHLEDVKTNTLMLFIDRWVGIEGVMSVSSYPHLGWQLWEQAWSENFSNSGTSFYDLEIAANSPYKKMKNPANHFISLPGFIAFFYYPGSLLLLFISVLAIGIFSAFFELFIYRTTGNNLLLASLFMQVVAYRYIHFGYAPKQSYLLFCTIVANALIFYGGNKLIKYFYSRYIWKELN